MVFIPDQYNDGSGQKYYQPRHAHGSPSENPQIARPLIGPRQHMFKSHMILKALIPPFCGRFHETKTIVTNTVFDPNSDAYR